MKALDRFDTNGFHERLSTDPHSTGRQEASLPPRPQDTLRTSRQEQRRFNPVKRLVLWCSGARRDLLERTPSEGANYVGLGSAVLTTGTFAAISSTTALAMALRTPVLWMVPIGIVWGLIILSLDRWLVATARAASAKGRLIVFLPRLLLAGFIGVMIAEPLLLSMFDPEIQAKAVELRTTDATAQGKRLEGKYLPLLNDVDKRMAKLRDQVKEREAKVQAFYSEAIGEAEGTSGTRLLGRGPVFAEKWRKYQSEQASLERLQRQTDEELIKLRTRRRQIQNAWDRERASADATINRNNGLLLRIDALSALTRENTIVLLSTWAVRILIVLIDALAVLVKILQSLNGPRPYDKLAAAHEHEEEREAERVRNWSEVKDEVDRADADAAKLPAEEQKALLTLRRNHLLYLIAQHQRDLSLIAPITVEPHVAQRDSALNASRPAPSKTDRRASSTGLTSLHPHDNAGYGKKRSHPWDKAAVAAAVIAAVALITATVLDGAISRPPPSPPPMNRPCARATEPCGRILSPINGKKVPRNFTVEGVLAKIPQGNQVWVATQIGNHLWPKEPKIPSGDRHWSQEVVEGGNPRNGKFSLVLLMVDQAGDRKIRRWLRGSRAALTRIPGSTKLDVVGELTLK